MFEPFHALIVNIDFLPKLGMNGYFVQFNVPHNFFNRWYEHQSNPTIPGETLSIEDVEHMWTHLEEEIFKRDLMYHAMGHGWTSIPFGIEGDWDSYSEEIAPEIKQYFAEVNGKRELWNRPKDTNLCFSNPQVRNIKNILLMSEMHSCGALKEYIQSMRKPEITKTVTM